MLKNLYDQNQKPAMPDDSQDKISDPSGENPENGGPNSDYEIVGNDWVFGEDWVATLTDEDPVVDTLLSELGER